MTPSWVSAARLPNLALGWCFWMSHWTVPAALAAGASKRPAETASTANALDILPARNDCLEEWLLLWDEALRVREPHRCPPQNARSERKGRQTGLRTTPCSLTSSRQSTSEAGCRCGKSGLGAGLIRRRTASEASVRNVSELGRGQRRRGAHGAQWLDWEFEARKTKEKPRERRRAKA